MSADGAQSQAVLIVGAGRSGTSAVARGVKALGVELGDRLKPPTAKNPTGFFEDEDLLRISKDARASLGLTSESVAIVEDDAWDTPALDALCKEAVETIRERFGQAPFWGFKYAQTLRLLPFWERVLADVGCRRSWVLATRNPLSVARSRQKLDPLRGVQEKSDTEWLICVVPYFRRLLGDPLVVVDYDLLMQEPKVQLERIAERLSIPLDERAREGIREFSEEFLIGGMRHTVFDDADLDAAANPLTADAYRWLRRLACDETTTDDAKFLESWQRIEDAFVAQAPTLRYVDHVVALLREAEARGLRGLGLRLQKRLKRVRFIARAYGERKLRQDVAATKDVGRGAGKGVE